MYSQISLKFAPTGPDDIIFFLLRPSDAYMPR